MLSALFSTLVPSALLTAFTNHVTMDVASAPLLWVLPLAYAFWTAFHPPEYATKFAILAPLTLENFVNGATKKDMAEFVDYVVHYAHRTLQQRMMALFMDVIQAWAKSSFDLRNEATVKLAQKIMSKLDKYDVMLPLI